MITLQRVGDVIKFTFQDNPLYLNNGTIEVPVNSLSLLIDESDIATFKKNNGDAFLSCPLTELGMTKEQLIQWYKDNAVDEGISPEEVEDIVESATTNLFGYAEYDSNSQRINFKHDASGSVISYIDASDFVIDGMIDNVEIVTVQGIKYLKITFNTESGKEPILIPLSDIFNPNEYYTKSEVDEALSGKVDTDVFDEKERVIAASLTDLDERKQDTLVSGTNIKTINNESILGSGNIDIQGGGKAIEAGRGIAITTGETADTVSFNLPISAGTGTNSLVVGGSTTANGNSSFAGGDDAIASGNWSFAFGRAQATNNYTFAANGRSQATMGYSAAFNTSKAKNTYAFSCGTSEANGHTSFASGWDNKSLNDYESSFGYYNVSSKGSTTFGDSGNTIFSVGNGSNENARHNAFEIRQNGDIYITLDGSDVKLQDQLGGSITVDSALDSGSTNPVENRVLYNKIDEIEEVTAAGINAVNDKFGGLSLVKLTQAEYDALTVKDNNVLYVIV